MAKQQQEQYLEIITISTKKKFPSLNAWYAGQHYRVRSNEKKVYQGFFEKELAPFIGKKLKKMKLSYRYNNRYDVDNTIPAVKIFVDTMKVVGIIMDDTPKYFTGLELIFDGDLQPGTSIFTVYGIV